MNGIITMASSSSSSLYGNVGCAIRELIMSKFPYDYFKYTNVSTEVAFRNFRRFFGRNTTEEIRKRRFPYLIMQPIYQIPDPDSFLQGIPLTKNIDDLQFGVDSRNLFTVVKDNKYDYNLKFKLNRDRIEYDVRIAVATLHQQLDLYKALVNHIIWDRSYYHNAALEAVIPKSIITYMSKLCRMDIDQNPELIPIFIKHLNDCSAGYPITYKMRNASATDEFFMYYMHNLVVTFTDLSIESVNKKGMVDDFYELTFRVSAEFNLPGLFVIDGNTEKARKIKVDLISTSALDYENNANVDYIPLFTISNLWNRYPKDLDGMQLYGTTIFTTNAKSIDKTDTVDISCVFDSDHIRVLRLYSGYQMRPDTITRVIILKNNEELDPKSDYYVDWNKLQVVIKNPDNLATYRLIIYINSNKFNDVLRDAMDNYSLYDKYKLNDNTINWSKFFDNPDIATYLMVNDIFEDDIHNYSMRIEEEEYPLGMMYNTEDTPLEEIETKEFVAERLMENTEWTGDLQERSVYTLRTTTYNTGEYEYFFKDEDSDERNYLVNYITADGKSHSQYYMQVNFGWEDILGDRFLLCTVDTQNNYVYSIRSEDGITSYITNMVDYVEGEHYAENIMSVKFGWEEILGDRFILCTVDTQNNYVYSIKSEDGSISYITNMADYEDGEHYSSNIMTVRIGWADILGDAFLLCTSDVDNNYTYTIKSEDGEAYLTNVTDYVEGQHYSSNTLTIRIRWADLLEYSLYKKLDPTDMDSNTFEYTF